jgi:hypothetical protein
MTFRAISASAVGIATFMAAPFAAETLLRLIFG